MREISRRDVGLGALFAGLAAGCWGLRPRRTFARLSAREVEAAIPDQVGLYRAETGADFVLPPKDELSTKLYDQVAMRVYAAAGQAPIMAVFAYGSAQNLTLQLHRPDECYPMQGFRITPLAPVALRLDGRAVPANVLTARRDDRVEQILFWSRIGPTFPEGRWEETRLIVEDNLRGRMPDGMVARLSILSEDRPRAIAEMTAFADLFGRTLSPAGRGIVLGERAATAG